MTWRLRILVLFGAFVLSAPGRLTARADATGVVYISAADSKGAAITDLKASDLSVKENGQDRAIAGLQEASGPMTVCIIDDDNGSGFYQSAVLQFIQALGDKAEYAIRQFNPAPSKILDYTSDVTAIQGALDKISGRGKVQ